MVGRGQLLGRLAEQAWGARRERWAGGSKRGGSLRPGDGGPYKLLQGQSLRMRGEKSVSVLRGVFLPKSSQCSLRKENRIKEIGLK